MNRMLWFLLCGGYWMAIWAAGRQKKSAEAALCFLDGFYLAMLCFAILPVAMETGYFYLAAAFAGIGIVVGFFLEKRKRADRWMTVLLFTAFLSAQYLQKTVHPFLLAFLGGIGLYHASSGIILDKIEIGKALLSGMGFLFGTFLFMNF